MQHTQHHCQTLITDIQLLLDGELDRHKENKVRLEMQQCDKCLQFYNGQSKLKQAISTRVTRMSCGEDFKATMLSKIRGL